MASLAQPQPRALIYVRVSTAGQEDGTSLETQEAQCRWYAAEHGYTVDDQTSTARSTPAPSCGSGAISSGSVGLFGAARAPR